MTLVKQSNIDAYSKIDVKFYIKDILGNWVDFSDRSNSSGIDSLLSVGRITNKVESSLGALVTTIQNVMLKNNDGFFNKPFPLLKNISGGVASFGITSGYKRSVLRGRECKIVVQTRVVSNPYGDSTNYISVDSILEETVGHFFIDNVIPNFAKKSISLKLISLDGKLQEKDASGIKNGYGFYDQRSVSFLIEEILKSEFAEDGVLPNTYVIDKSPFLPTLNSDNAVSNLGRPPLWDGSEWKNLGLHTRALCYANVRGTGDYLYLGCDEQLWVYDPIIGVYAAIDTSTIPSGYYIKKIWYDPLDDRLVIITQVDEYWGGYLSGRERDGWNTRIYYWNGTLYATGLIKVASFQYIIRACKSHFIYGYYYIGWGYQNAALFPVTPMRGENAKLPFPQDIKTLDIEGSSLSTTYYSDLISFPIDGPFALASEDRTFNSDKYSYLSKGTCAHIVRSLTSGWGGCSMYSIGQQMCTMLSNQKVHNNYRTALHVYYWEFGMIEHAGYWINIVSDTGNNWSSGTQWCRLGVFDIDNGLLGTTWPPTTLEHSVPLCMKVNGSSNSAYVFFLKQYNDATIFKSYGICLDLTNVNVMGSFNPWSSPWENMAGETGDDRYWMVINVEFFGSNNGSGSTDKVVIVLFNRKTGMYVLGFEATSVLASNQIYTNMTKLKISVQPFTGLAIDTVDDCIYAYGSGEGKVYKITKGGTLTVLNEAPVIAEEFGLLSGLAVNNSHSFGEPEVYGVSSPTTHLDSFYSYQPGKYYLFRLHQSISDLVSYADFDGISKMEAIKLLSQSRDGLSFFDRDGNFHYLNRVYSSTGAADYIIGGIHDGSSAVFQSVKMNLGYDKVYNVVKVKSYVDSFAPPSLDALTLLERTDQNRSSKDLNKLPFVNYSIEQKDTDRKKVYAYCVRGGSTTDGESRWKYSTVDNEIEAILRSDAGAGVITLYLNSVFGGNGTLDGIHVGDFVTVVNVDTGEFITREITVVTVSNNSISISSSFGIILKEKSVVIIGRGYKTSSITGSKITWSDEGVSYVLETASSTFFQAYLDRDLSIGTVVRFGDDVYEYRIIDVRGLNWFEIERADGAAGGFVTIPSVNDKIYAYYSPKAVDGNEIGGTNVFIKWSAGEGTEETDYTKTFIPGDRLVIDCPGKSLAADPSSLQVVVDGSSVSIHDRNELNIDNRFMPRQVAKEMSRRILFYHSQPRFYLEVTISLMPNIDIVTDDNLTTVDVENPELFPSSKNCTERFLIESVSHDLKRKLTTLTLVAIEPY